MCVLPCCWLREMQRKKCSTNEFYFNTLKCDKDPLAFLSHIKCDFEPPFNWMVGNSMSPRVSQESKGKGMMEAIG